MKVSVVVPAYAANIPFLGAEFDKFIKAHKGYGVIISRGLIGESIRAIIDRLEKIEALERSKTRLK